VEAALQAKVLDVLVEVHRILCTSSMSADSLLCNFGMEGGRLFDFDGPLPGVFLSQPLLICTQETQLLASSSFLGLRWADS
jgi:hypothetical protein